MIPGTLCDERLFAPQARHLRGLAEVIVLNYRALRSREPWLRGLLNALPDRFSIAGFSLGGLWALELLRRAPQRIERLALIASNAQPAGAAVRRRSKALRKRWRANGRQHSHAELARRAEPEYFHAQTKRRWHRGLLQRMARDTPGPSALQQFFWAAERPAGFDILATFRRPLLIVSGDHDRICPNPLQQRMANVQPLARWVRIPRCGHFVPLEAPARLSGALRQWLLLPIHPAGHST